MVMMPSGEHLLIASVDILRAGVQPTVAIMGNGVPFSHIPLDDCSLRLPHGLDIGIVP